MGGSSGANDLDPWLVLTLESSRDPAPSACVTLVRAHLWRDSNGADTSIQGHAADGATVFFGADSAGSMAPASAPTVLGSAVSYFVPAVVSGQSLLGATLDNQTVEIWLTLLESVFCDGFETGDVSQWSTSIP